VIFSGCAGASHAGKSETRLTILARQDYLGRAVFHLDCEPAGGDVPSPSKASAALKKDPKILTKTDAYQENRNLLLSRKAHANSIPGLEILANDVRCTHGSTVGQVDREQLFYLMSRGLPENEAERMIVGGFFAQALDRIGREPVREALARALEARIP
jgi:hypothetical protein